MSFSTVKFGREKQRRGPANAFTVVEAVIALAILALFGLATTITLDLFNNNAALSRNAEAARGVVDDYVGFLLADNTAMPSSTGDGVDIDGDGVPDGVICPIGGATTSRSIVTATNPTGVVPLVVTRTATPDTIVNGTLYWRVQAVGSTYGLKTNAELVQVNFTLAYTYRNRTYYYKAMTYKAATN